MSLEEREDRPPDSHGVVAMSTSSKQDHGEEGEALMAWHLTGNMIELCSCKMLCPCWLGPAEPDQGWCSGALVFDIQQGAADGVDLNGFKVVFAADWPGDFWKGNGTARLYIDETASAEQRRELEAIFSGRKGGLLEPLLGAVIAKWLPARTTPIAIQRGDALTITVGNVGQVAMQPLKDQTGRPTKVQGAAAQAAFQSDSMELASSKGSRWSDPELRQWEGDSGTLHTVTWSA
jgi:hypothetical protein